MKGTLLQLVLAIGVFVGAFQFALSSRAPGNDLARLRNTTGPEVALVMIVDPECDVCGDPTLPGFWRVIMEGVLRVTPDSVPVRLVGVSMSNLPQGGTEFLERFGPFHEVLVGGGLRNSGALRYLFEDFHGPEAVPQVVVLDRSYKRVKGDFLGIESEKVRARAWGLVMIREMAARYSAPSPTSERPSGP